jgi:hypothetical protein
LRERSSRRFGWYRRPKEEQGVSALLRSRPSKQCTIMNQESRDNLVKDPKTTQDARNKLVEQEIKKKNP